MCVSTTDLWLRYTVDFRKRLTYFNPRLEVRSFRGVLPYLLPGGWLRVCGVWMGVTSEVRLEDPDEVRSRSRKG